MPVTAAKPAQFDRVSQQRRSMIAKVQIAQKQLQMAEDDYRQLLFDATGETSLRACNDGQLARVLDRLKSKGFKPLPGKGNKGAASHPMARKARALWISLYQLGEVRNQSEEALEAFAKRQLGCERLVWARQSDANRLIEALKSMAQRAGWHQRDLNGGKLSPLTLQSHLCQVILGRLIRAKVAAEGWGIETAAWRLCGFKHDTPWTIEAYAEVAGLLGDQLRQHGGHVQ